VDKSFYGVMLGMSKPEVTKQVFANTFKSLLKRDHYEKINARDIITFSGFSNKTFYYHFRDKEHLVTWIFHKEIEEILLKIANVEYYNLLGNQMIKKDPYFHKPFYLILCEETEFYFCKYWEFVIDNLFNNKDFYTEVLNYEGQNNLKNYVIQLYHKQFKDNFMLLLNSKEFDEKAYSLEVDILAEYFTNAFLGTLIYWAQNDIEEYQPNMISTKLTFITERCLEFLNSNSRVRPLLS
jgi:AcrR family transcriptional regulator